MQALVRIFIASIAILLGSATAHASAPGSGWAWVTSSGSVGGSYFYNSTGGSVIAAKLATGQYEVDFAGLSSGGGAQVVGYGSNAQCKLPVTPLVGGARVSVFVTCYSPLGVLVDSAFVVVFDAPAGASSALHPGAHLSTGGGTSPTVLVGSSWNSSGLANTISWDPSSRTYVATLPGMTSGNAAVHVTAYGGNADRCKPLGWGTGVVYVSCYDPAGNTVASGFSLSYRDTSLLAGHVGGHAWITHGRLGGGYAAAEGASGCEADGSFSVARSPFNAWDLEVALTASNWPADFGSWVVPMVTAYGASANYCSILGWDSSSSGTTSVQVRCFDGAGNQIDASTTELTLSITNRYPPAPC